ncbi:MAG: hypothetical protein AB7H90_22780 [Alphaproteobacteria bacterium]
MTLAMAAGIETGLWSVENVTRLIDKQAGRDGPSRQIGLSADADEHSPSLPHQFGFVKVRAIITSRR